MRHLSLFLVCLLLSACLSTGKRGDEGAPAFFDLGPATQREATARTLPMALEVRLVPWLDTTGIVYRLNYAEPARVREYAQARWSAAPAQMIQSRLGGTLGLLASGQGKTNCLVRLELDEFAQWFVSPGESRAVLRGRVLWLDRTRQVLADRPLAFEESAPSPDSAGAVAGLGRGVDRLSELLVQQESELAAAGKLAACRR